MVIFGSIVAGFATFAAIFGIFAVIRLEIRYLNSYCMALTAVAGLELLRAIVDLATAASWCESHCGAQDPSTRCQNGLDFCKSQIRFAGGCLTLGLCIFHGILALFTFQLHNVVESIELGGDAGTMEGIVGGEVQDRAVESSFSLAGRFRFGAATGNPPLLT